MLTTLRKQENERADRETGLIRHFRVVLLGSEWISFKPHLNCGQTWYWFAFDAVPYLPIVDRELRISARAPSALWRRVAVAGGAMLLLSLVLLAMRQMPLTMIGLRVFQCLGAAGMIFAMVAGAIAAADAISREKREGTLGLLFLTDLSAADIVLGKIFASCVELVLGLLATLPILAIPMLIGGVTLGSFARMALACFDLLFLSLAIGICASSMLSSGRIAFAVSIVVLLLLTFGFVVIIDPWLHLPPYSKTGAFLYCICPLWTIIGTLEPTRQGTWHIWVNLAGTHLLSWILIAIACRFTARYRVTAPGTQMSGFWARFVQTAAGGTQRFRTAWRMRKLQTKPLVWLLGRDLAQRRLLWITIGLSVICWSAIHLRAPRRWPDSEAVVMWPFFTHYLFCLWLCIEAPRRLSDDKASGALELLLCTPVGARKLVHACRVHLARTFGWPLLFLMVFYCYGLLAFLWFRGRIAWSDELSIGVAGAFVIPVQVWSLMHVGLYQGLASGSSLKATVWLAGKVCVLPWILFFLWMLGCLELGPRRFVTNSGFVMASWAMIHWFVCVVFAGHAMLKLTDLRALASQTRP